MRERGRAKRCCTPSSSSTPSCSPSTPGTGVSLNPLLLRRNLRSSSSAALSASSLALAATRVRSPPRTSWPSSSWRRTCTPATETWTTQVLKYEATQTAPQQNVGRLASVCSLFTLVHVLCLSVKDVDSTSGSGPESFYTPETSPTDRDSSSSGGLLRRVSAFVFMFGRFCLDEFEQQKKCFERLKTNNREVLQKPN